MVALVALAALRQADRLADEPIRRAVYVGFGVQTFVPVTTSNVWNGQGQDVTQELQKYRKEIAAVLRWGKQGSFVPGAVRLAIETASGQTFVDEFGGVRTNAEETKLDGKQFGALKALMPDVFPTLRDDERRSWNESNDSRTPLETEPIYRAVDLPFSAETNSPVTPTNIWTMGARDVTSALNLKRKELFALLGAPGKGRFDPDFVRLAVAGLSGRTMYVDRFGGVATSEGTRKLNKTQFDALKSLIPKPLVRPGAVNSKSKRASPSK